MHERTTVLGIDVGSVSASFAQVDRTGALVSSGYALHRGDARGALQKLLATLPLDGVLAIASTTPAAGAVVASRSFDSQVAFIRAAKHLHPDVAALLVVGGERFGLVHFGADGRYQNSRSSSPCAAGTGSFLDQQAGRLGLEGSAALSRTALAAEGALPKIASRCSVFAKTDLIHAQQQGHSLEAICNGLCHGLAVNVVDTLFGGETAPEGTVVFAGGVSRNEAVRQHIERLIGRAVVVDDSSHLYGAFGAALLLSDELAPPRRFVAGSPRVVSDVLRDEPRRREAFYPPLSLKLSRYPDFSAGRRHLFAPSHVKAAAPVEVDVYETVAPGRRVRAWLGIDIGSTSTKAVLVDADAAVPPPGSPDDHVLAGFYTRTAGQPLLALQALLEAVAGWAAKDGFELAVAGAGCTGSGRKFIGALVGADEILDEITAHARAAWQLDPRVDTIIEIGGQDAKFTALRDGAVTLSIMNDVCAAGTGSFIEEQAARLSCPLSDLAARTEGRAAPLTSDRCTVFMERDINHFLAAGHSVDEILAASLHAVRENYLRKVAREPYIGKTICFQGATAKNRSLVAAFEQKLERPIHVSRYCHLTGALGVALVLAERRPATSRFGGISLYREEIPVHGEVCTLCTHHCKLKLARVRGQTVAYGMLCGREHGDERHVSTNKSGFDLMKTVRRAFAAEPSPPRRDVTIGIPAALHLVHDLPLWRRFFDALGVRTVTSEGAADVVSSGKRLAGAEFCAPVAAFHGHVAALAQRADFLFVPCYQEEGDRPAGTRRNHCYYTQFAPSLAATMPEPGLAGKLLSPVLENYETRAQRIVRLRDALRPALGKSLSLLEVSRALGTADRYVRERRARLRAILPVEREGLDDVAVVLIGRPYTVLSPAMNKDIPDLIAALGVKCFSQEMLTVTDEDRAPIAGLLNQVHWANSARVLAAAEVVGKAEGLYPVILTSFKCGPDSCHLEFVRRILDSHGKPYLVLQLDEHESRTGYETRIEAAVRSFRNHRSAARRKAPAHLPVNPPKPVGIRERTLLLPRWDRYVCTLMAANLRREGLDARVLDENPELIARGLRHNSGQCIPLNLICEGFVDYVTRHGLDPARTALWIHSAQVGCNIGAFPQTLHALLESHGKGFEKAAICVGEFSTQEVSVRAIFNQYLVLLCAGYLRRMGCQVRPYEARPGETDLVLEESLKRFAEAFEKGADLLPVVKGVVDRLLAIDQIPGRRPKVAIVGDLYARDNDVLNQDLIHLIEAEGGEAVTTPYTEYLKVIAAAYFRKWIREGRYRQVATSQPVLAGSRVIEKKFLREFERVLGPTPEPKHSRPMEEVLAKFSVTTQHTGETLDNLLKVSYLAETCPGLALVVQTSPAFCCASLVTEALSRRIEAVTGVPMVTITYDGTRGAKNQPVIPYLHFLKQKRAEA